MSDQIFMQGDAVFYVGEKLKQELSGKDGKSHKGWIHARVQGEKNAYVVWFPDTKDSDSFIIDGRNLDKVRPPKVQKGTEGGPDIMPVRKRKTEEDT